MPKTERFTFLTDSAGRQEIKDLAERLQRSESDAIRVIVREKVRELEAQHTKSLGTREPASVAA